MPILKIFFAKTQNILQKVLQFAKKDISLHQQNKIINKIITNNNDNEENYYYYRVHDCSSSCKC